MKTLKYTMLAALLTVALPALAQDKTAQGCKNMNGSCMAMMDIQKQDAALDGLVAAMNSADASNKMDAIAAVVNKMVEIRKIEKEKMAEMMKQTKTCGKESMDACPMMGNDKKAPMPMPSESPKVKSQME